jgi:hypothetical protein
MARGAPARIGRWITVGIVVLLTAYIITTIIPRLRAPSEWEQTVAALRSLPHERVMSAAQTYARDRNITNGHVPLHELVSDGYLRQGDVGSLWGRDATVLLTNDHMYPQMIWIRVSAVDGSEIVMLTDGAVGKLKFARERDLSRAGQH